MNTSQKEECHLKVVTKGGPLESDTEAMLKGGRESRSHWRRGSPCRDVSLQSPHDTEAHTEEQGI